MTHAQNIKSRFLTVVLVAVFAILIPASTWAADSSAGQTYDLGARQAGQKYPFAVQAQNSDCEDPQDFRFEPHGMKWMRFKSGNVVRSVGAGQSKQLPVQLDFSNVKPGHYSGQLDVICETCSFLVFTNCFIDKQTITLQVDVVAGQVPPQQPQAVQLQPSSTGANVDADVLKGLSASERRALENALSQAAAARSAVELARKKKKDCDDELAKLKAAYEAAKDAADAADAEAKAADADVQAAQKALNSYADELKAAEQAMDRAYKTMQMQAAYRSVVAGEDGTGSARYAEAQRLVDKANDDAVAAQKNYMKVRGSLKARQDALAQAQAAAKAKHAEAAKAQSEAAKAKAAYEAKLRECLQLGKNAEAASQAQQAAEAATDKARETAAAAAAKARQQAIKTLKDQITDKKRAIAALREKIKRRAHVITQALKALRTIGVINPNRTSDKDVDLEKIVWEYLGQLILGEGRARAVRVQTFEVFTILRGLKAAYGLIAIKQATLTPWNAQYLGDDNLIAWLKKHGYAKDDREAREIVEAMKKYIEHKGDTGYLEKELQSDFDTLEQEQRKLAEMESALQALEAGGR